MPRSHGFISPLRVLICALAFAIAWPAFALADSARFEIKPEPLGVALKTFAQQAHMQLLYEYTIVRDVEGNPVTGVFDKHAALEELLRNTGLEAVFSSADAATIRPIRKGLPSGARVSHPKQNEKTGEAREKPTSMDPSLTKPLDGLSTGLYAEKSSQQSAGDEEFPALQEIIVTAQKYRQRAFDVPISLDVVTGRELERHHIVSLNDLQYDVPGLYVLGGETEHRIFLRGVGNVTGNGSLVGEYIDEADISGAGQSGEFGQSTGDVRLYDLARVEVLRGPQGTLYGDGSMGGVIRYVTNQPVLDRFQMAANMAALYTQYGAPGQRLDAMLNTPVIQGTLGLRFAGQFEHDGGWINQPAANLKHINDRNVADVRIEGLWRPTAHFAVNLMQIIHRESFGLGLGEDSNGNFTQVYNLTTPNGDEAFNLTDLTMTYNSGWFRLLSASTYLNHSQNTRNEGGSETFGTSTEWFLDNALSFDDEDFSEEVRLQRNGNGPWQWTVGGFYKHYHDFNSTDEYFGSPGPFSSASHETASGAERSSSWAAFADTSYKLFNRLTVGAGVRYFTDREGQRIGQQGINGITVFPGATVESRFSSTDPRFYLQYHVSSHINAYASASKGFRSGGFNGPFAPPYEPESLWTYDLGLKTRFLDNRLRTDTDAFYGNYSNYVAEGLIPSLGKFAVYNVGKARIKGVDADLAWQANLHWSFSINGEYVNSRLVSIGALFSGYAVGNRVPLVPDYALTAAVERNFRWHKRPGYLQMQFSQMSPVQLRYPGLPLLQSDAIRFLNFDGGLHWSKNLKFGLYVQNLLNERGHLDPTYTLGLGSRAQPRTFGIESSVTFE